MPKMRNLLQRAVSGLRRVKGRMNVFFMDGFTRRATIDQAGALFSVAWTACELAKMRAIGSLPFHVYRRSAEGRERVENHPVERLFARRWNSMTTADAGIQALILRMDSYGDAYVRLSLDRLGNPTAAYLVTAPVTVAYDSETDTVAYDIESGGDDFTPGGRYSGAEMLHFRTPISTDSVYGRSLCELAAVDVGLSIDVEKFYQLMLENGQHMSGYFTTDNQLSRDDLDDLRSEARNLSGIDHAGESRVFHKGVHWNQNPVNISGAGIQDQQLWTLQQICRITSVPPQKVYDLSHATYSNVEQGQIDFCQSTILPYVTAFERVVSGIFDDRGETDLYAKWDMSGLLRGSFADRMQGYRTGRYMSLYSINDIRAMEDLNRVEGGDSLLLPQAYALLETDGSITPVQSNSTGRAPTLSPVEDDAHERIISRFREKGVNDSSRAFAAKVMQPIALAYTMAGLPFDMRKAIGELADEAGEEN